ncbi:MAG: hypothetical protein DKT66_12565 [Candidatus Melainabacteria bacterium]|nr:MAG: hypothetical protein DKT66_12565 [Candidatus Melainabacteria bacterium]
MSSSLGDFTPAVASSKDESLKLEAHTDAAGVTTYQLRTRDTKTQIETEKTFDSEQRLIRIVKHSSASQSETELDPVSGSTLRITEHNALPDGSTLTKATIYREGNQSNESVVVISAEGEVIRRVERQMVGMHTVFQGQTEYQGGSPQTSVNHYVDITSGRLLRREQIQWFDSKHRSATENLYFDEAGYVTRFTKTLFHSGAGAFLEESQEFYTASNNLERRELCVYNAQGVRTCVDVVEYADDGEIIERMSQFFDEHGNPVGGNSSEF